ncbi:hypothetical protein GCM10009546_39840 [Actinomadura livida]|uniref:Uncharacterized protein n=1 Tax=Actinomadura livida TaxID=79909 RepID=A0ABP3PVB7_9ACTN|nr:hypothetical protein GCM10010208_48600 [Actinomadura livida]
MLARLRSSPSYIALRTRTRTGSAREASLNPAMSHTRKEHIPLGRHRPEAGRTVSVTGTSPTLSANPTLQASAAPRNRTASPATVGADRSR